MMSKIIAVLALAMVLANSAHAEFRWKHPGANPYATSREAAMQTRESAFKKLGFPSPVVALFMEATKKPGEKIKLSMGDHLTTMLSKGGVVHRDVVIAWEAPIRGTELVAPAEKWQVTWEGKVFTAFLFEVCQNWSSVIASAPPSVAPSACTTGRTLILRAYSEQSLPPYLREQEEALVAAANGRESKDARVTDRALRSSAAYRDNALSRTIGKALYVSVLPAGKADVQVQLLDPVTLDVVERLGTLQLIAGAASISLTEEQHTKIVETIWPGNFKSPTVSGGLHRIWLFGYEWGDNHCMVVSGVSVP